MTFYFLLVLEFAFLVVLRVVSSTFMSSVHFAFFSVVLCVVSSIFTGLTRFAFFSAVLCVVLGTFMGLGYFLPHGSRELNILAQLLTLNESTKW